jgi:putative transposase
MARSPKLPWVGEKIGPNPTDRGKGGVKRSLLTDAHGMPLAIVIDGANRHDMKLARPMLESLEVSRPSLLAVWPQGLVLGQGI